MLHDITLNTEKTLLDNTILYKYFIFEYKAEEFGIFDQDNHLIADAFESFEHAQSWYINFVQSKKALGVLNDKIFETI